MTDNSSLSILFSIVDPMCSWCWGFRENHQALVATLPSGVEHRYLLGGLAPDSDDPMPEETKAYVKGAWQKVGEVTGATFNFSFWDECQPRRSTYPSCRAVLAAKSQGLHYEEAMIYGIQKAYYLHAKNPSDHSTLIEIANEIGLNIPSFREALGSEEVDTTFRQHRALAKQLGSQGFPSLVLVHNNQSHFLVAGYSEVSPILEAIESIIAT